MTIKTIMITFLNSIVYGVIYKRRKNFFLAVNSHRLFRGRHEYKWCHRHHLNATLCWVHACYNWVLITWHLGTTSISSDAAASPDRVRRFQLHVRSSPYFCYVNVHLPTLQFPSVRLRLCLLYSLTIPILKYAHSKCLLILSILDFLQSVSQNRSYVWLLLRCFPVLLGRPPPQPRESPWARGPDSMGCQRPERWSSLGSNTLGFPHCDLNLSR